MTQQQWKELNDAAVKGTIKDDLNPALMFNMIHTELLKQIASGEIDCRALAAIILKDRGVK